MFSAKFCTNKKNEEINKTINNIINYIFEKVRFEKTRMLSDNSSMEVVAGNEEGGAEDAVVVELIIRKHIVINNSDFEDRDKLDQHIRQIKHFCEQAKSIEDLKYLPINMR